MQKLPDNIIRFDVVRIEQGTRKMCVCENPFYRVDRQNRLIRCAICNAIVDPFEAMTNIARHYERIEEWTECNLKQRMQIENYRPRRVVIKDLEKKYIQNEERAGLEPTCPHCGEQFSLKDLLSVPWRRKVVKLDEAPVETK